MTRQKQIPCGNDKKELVPDERFTSHSCAARLRMNGAPELPWRMTRQKQIPCGNDKKELVPDERFTSHSCAVRSA
jgi:hypothetical protein